MRTQLYGLLVALAVLGGPASVRAQNEVIPRPFVGPLSHPRYEGGGFYTALEFVYWTQKNPIGSQQVARRGFVDTTGAISGTPGTFFGSGASALNTGMLSETNNYTPGFNLTAGYRFEGGWSLQASWVHLTATRTSASASVIPPNYSVGADLADTFLFSPVTNFPPEFAGHDFNVVGTGVTPGTTYGIWNAATVMQLEFKQTFEMVDLLARIPVTENDDYRSYAYIGPRVLVLWERFKWRTVDSSILGNGSLSNNIASTNTGPTTNAIYSNVVSNRLYGPYLGTGHEFRLGDSPLGTFSVYVDAGAALYLDLIKGRAEYKLEDGSIAVKYRRNTSSLAPSVDAKIGFQWYIYEAITVRLGYNYMGIFNTGSSNQPIDFNVGGLRPTYNRDTYRYFSGLDFGVGLVW